MFSVMEYHLSIQKEGVSVNHLKSVPVPGLIVIFIILALFVAAVIVLCRVYFGYRRITRLIDEGTPEQDEFLRSARREFAAAYKSFGENTNTPGIIENVMGTKLGGLLFGERFLNNSVSIFVTLGLFGTFLGLSLAVASLTDLIGYSNTSEWLSVLDSVGGGLMSALSGMGVAFYTSLVGAGCSILLTILRTILNPQAEREKLETRLELWLDTEVAPDLAADTATDEVSLVKRMIAALTGTADTVQASIQTAGEALVRTAAQNRVAMDQFDQTVGKFNAGVHDFTEVDYNLRGSVERMDLAVRDLANALREVNRRMDGERR